MPNINSKHKMPTINFQIQKNYAYYDNLDECVLFQIGIILNEKSCKSKCRDTCLLEPEIFDKHGNSEISKSQFEHLS